MELKLLIMFVERLNKKVDVTVFCILSRICFLTKHMLLAETFGRL